MFRAIREGDQTVEFVCERDETMVRYLHEVALAQEGVLSRTFVLQPDDEQGDAPPILGFYSLCMTRIARSDLPSDCVAALVDRGMVPAALLGQLARDDRAGRDVGEQLLVDALSRCKRASEEIGCAGVLLHTARDRLETWYARYGFRRVGHTPTAEHPMRTMYLPIGSIP